MSSVAQIYTGKIELSARPDVDFSVVQHVRVVREISDQFCFLRTDYPTKNFSSFRNFSACRTIRFRSILSANLVRRVCNFSHVSNAAIGLNMSVWTLDAGCVALRCATVNRFEVIEGEIFKQPPLSSLRWSAILGAMGLGFCLSLLIFMDHNIAGAMVNSPDNR